MVDIGEREIMAIDPINPDKWKLLVIDRDDVFLPKGFVSAILSPDVIPSEYERIGGLWKIVEVDDRPYPIPKSDRPDFTDRSVITGPDIPPPPEKNLIYESGRIIHKTETAQELVDTWAASNPSVKPLPIPDHLDRSHSVIWDYGPGRTYSTPQAAYDGLFASVGATPFAQKHFIRGWSGTYGVVGSNVLFFNPIVGPGSRENILICDVESGETVIWDGEAAGTILDGNAVSHVNILDIVLGNATYGLAPIPWGNNRSCDDWRIIRCESDGAMGSISAPIAGYDVREFTVIDCYVHDTAAGGAGVITGRHNSHAGDIFGIQIKGCRLEANFGIFAASELSLSIYNNTIRAIQSCLQDNGGNDALVATILNNIFYGETGTACDCVHTGATVSINVRMLSSDGNCYFPGDSGGNPFVTNGLTYTTLAEVQAAYGLEAHSIEADPLLNADMSIPAGSPCAETGVANSYAGYNGKVRGPQCIDIGAFQLTSPGSAIDIQPPSFDAIENDGDGDAVTLTITPPATGDYDLAQIFYRIFGSGSAWTDGGTYVGSQGVQGTKQVTGLDNITLYEFIIFTEFDTLHSVPTPTRTILCTDNTDEGDYINTEKKVVATLQADTGSGGLNETGNPMVKLIERGVKDAPNDYGKFELPAIGVYAIKKREIQDENEETIEKIFEMLFVIVERTGDIPEGEDTVKKIMARLETVIREQTSTVNLWTQLPISDLIKGAEGTLATIITESTAPVVHPDEEILQGDFVMYAMVNAEIQIPVSFDL